MKHVKWISSVVLLAAMSFSSQAELVRYSFAGKTTAKDTASGVEWLHFSYSYGKNYSSVLQELKGTLKGFRFATNAEVEQLFRNQFDDSVINYKGNVDSQYVQQNMLSNFNQLGGYGAGDWFVRGLYYDENGILRMAGLSTPQKPNAVTTIYGLNNANVYGPKVTLMATSYFIVKAGVGDPIYSINDPLNNPQWKPTQSIFDVPPPLANDVPAPFAPFLVALPLLFALRRRA